MKCEQKAQLCVKIKSNVDELQELIDLAGAQAAAFRATLQKINAFELKVSTEMAKD